MPAKPKRYDRFADFVLLKKLESGPIAELWRSIRPTEAGPGPLLTVCRFAGADRDAIGAAVREAAPAYPLLTGTSVVRDQDAGVGTRGTPWISWDYAGGRSLRTILDRARGSNTEAANPIPLDQALSIVERAAFSLETTDSLKYEGRRLVHGALIPELVWISEDGDIRLAGQMLGPGLVRSLGDPKIAEQIGGFFAPEIRQTAQPTPASDVFSLGALLYTVLTGKVPPDAQRPDALAIAVKDAKMALTEDPIPAEIRSIMERALQVNPAQRFDGPAAVRETLAALIHSGAYAPTTFNLAFYIHNLLRADMEEEAREREAESALDIRPYIVPITDDAVAPEPARATPPPASISEPPSARRSRLPMIAAIVVVVAAAAAAGVYYTMRGGTTAPDSPAPVATQAAAVPPPMPAATLPAEPLVAAVTDTGEAPEVQPDDAAMEAAKKKAIEDEVARRLQQEMMKLQTEYDRKLQQERESQNRSQTASQPPAAEVQPERAEKKPVVQAAATPPPAPIATETAAAAIKPPVGTDTAPVQTPVTPAIQPAAPAVPSIREGDLIGISDVDQPPKLARSRQPIYPPLARRQKAEATIILSALISETGRVIDVKVLRGDNRRLGLDEAAIEAVKGAIYSPALKNGKKVKTWLPVPVIFKAN